MGKSKRLSVIGRYIIYAFTERPGGVLHPQWRPLQIDRTTSHFFFRETRADTMQRSLTHSHQRAHPRTCIHTRPWSFYFYFFYVLKSINLAQRRQHYFFFLRVVARRLLKPMSRSLTS